MSSDHVNNGSEEFKSIIREHIDPLTDRGSVASSKVKDLISENYEQKSRRLFDTIQATSAHKLESERVIDVKVVKPRGSNNYLCQQYFPDFKNETQSKISLTSQTLNFPNFQTRNQSLRHVCLSEIPDAVKMKTNLKEAMPNISLKMPP
jgi:hypothetical protein